jgi:hypothetical protein
VISNVFGDLAKEFIQILRHLDYWSPALFPLIFLFKNKSGQIGAQEINCGFIKLFRENYGIQICVIFNELLASMDFLSRDHLRDGTHQIDTT